MMKNKLKLLLLLLAVSALPISAQNPVKVFILAGQSNMQGHGEMEKGEKGNLRYLVENDAKYKHLVDKDGEWAKRKDVFIRYTNRLHEEFHGPLTAGCGAYNYTIGPELQFGNVIGDYYKDNDVLLIKTSWGGKSLAFNFAPPTTVGGEDGYPTIPSTPEDRGYYYVQMLATVHEVVNNLSKYVPNYAGQGYEIVGLAWHQGWNDLTKAEFNAAYEQNMINLINDMRRDLGEPELPVVIATSGMRGKEVGKLESLAKGQTAVASHPAFKGQIKIVDTKDFWFEKEDSPANQNYHWNRNAVSYCLIGEAMAKAMEELIGEYDQKGIERKLRSARRASDKILAPLPPMGWNSWNAFEKDIDEEKIKAMADIMVESGMRELGYEYLVLDDAWMTDHRGENGELLADLEKFPNGMKAVGDYIHSKGLKFGIYECRGDLTCQNLPGSFLHEVIDMNTFASWGVDYIKMDACFAGRNGRLSSDDFTIYSEAIKNSGRSMVLSISDFGQGAWAWGGKTMGQLWRTSMDIFPYINSVYRCAETSGGAGSSHPEFNGLWQFAGPNHWNDPDMLQVGNLKSEAEDKVHFSLWSVLSAPLMMGNDLRKMSDYVKDILMAEELIAVNQDPRAVQGYKIFEADSTQIFMKPLADGTAAVLLLNKGVAKRDVTVKWSQIGLKGEQKVRDLWAKKDMGYYKNQITAEGLSQHGVLYIKVGEPSETLIPMPQPLDVSRYTITKSGVTYLSDICYIMKEYNHPAYDKSYDGGKIVVDGKTYKKGLGCTSSSTVMYKIDSKVSRFRAVVSITEAEEDGATGRFRVMNEDKFGGRVLFDSGKMKVGSTKEIDVDISDLDFLMLEFTGKKVKGVWADAQVDTRIDW